MCFLFEKTSRIVLFPECIGHFKEVQWLGENSFRKQWLARNIEIMTQNFGRFNTMQKISFHNSHIGHVHKNAISDISYVIPMGGRNLPWLSTN